MDVRVVEAGEEQASLEVDDLCVRAGQLADGGVVPDGQNNGTVERHGFGNRLGGILRPYLAVDEDDASVLSGSHGTDNPECQNGYEQSMSLHAFPWNGVTTIRAGPKGHPELPLEFTRSVAGLSRDGLYSAARDGPRNDLRAIRGGW